MAWARGRQPAIETAKAECLRRWPDLQLKCTAVYWNTKREGFVITTPSRKGVIAGERSASEAWTTCLAKLEDENV